MPVWLPTKDLNATDGLHLQESIHVTYDALCDIFGKPLFSDDKYDPIQIQWIIEFSDDVVATINDWKNYCDPSLITHWSVRGRDKKAANYIFSIIDDYINHQHRKHGAI